MKTILKLIVFFVTTSLFAQDPNAPSDFVDGIKLSTANQVTTADRVPVIDTDLKVNSWISSADLLDGLVSGSGTVNYLAKFTAAGTVGDSQVYDNGISVGIGTATPSTNALLDVKGTVKFGATSPFEIYLGSDGAVGGFVRGKESGFAFPNNDSIIPINGLGVATDGIMDIGSLINKFDTLFANAVQMAGPDQSFFVEDIGIRVITRNASLNIAADSRNDGELFQQWVFDPANPADYLLNLKQTVTAGNVRYNFSMVNDGVAYDDVLVLDKGKVGFGTDNPTAQNEILNEDPTLDFLKISSSEASKGDILTVEASTGKVIVNTNLSLSDTGVQSRITSTNEILVSGPEIELNSGEINLLSTAVRIGSVTPPNAEQFAVSGSTFMGGSLEVAGSFKDSNSSAGLTGQVLTSTVTGTAYSEGGLSYGRQGYSLTQQLLVTPNVLQPVIVEVSTLNNAFIANGTNTEFEATISGVYRLESIPQFISGSGGDATIEQLWQVDTGAGFVTDPQSVIQTTFGTNTEGTISCVTVVALNVGDKVRAMWASDNTNTQVNALTTITGNTAPAVQQFITFTGK